MTCASTERVTVVSANARSLQGML